MRILVTGSTGNIGRALAPMLLAAGHEIRTLDRPAQPRSNEWEHISADLRDVHAVRRAAHGMDAVMHLGAIAHDLAGPPDEVLSVNVQGTLNVLLACAEIGIGRMVYFSSINALGCVGGHRPSEYLPIDDSHPRHPMSPYQLSKHLGEESCLSFSRKHGITTVCLRPVLVVTPGNYSWAFGEAGSALRMKWAISEYWAYVDVDDVCDAAIRSLTVPNLTHDAFLLSADDTSVDVPTAELLDRYYPDTPWPKVGRDEYLAGNSHRSLIDCSHAKDVLGWQPRRQWREYERR